MVHGYHVAYLVLAIAIGVAGVVAGLLIEANPVTQGPARREKVGEGVPQPAEAG